MRSEEPIKQEFLYDLKQDPYEQNNLVSVALDTKDLLNKMLDKHVKSMPKPTWPQSVLMPVPVDKPNTEEFNEGDELIYWPN